MALLLVDFNRLLLDSSVFNLSLISILHFITWGYCLFIKGWVSDDIQGIAAFSDRFVQHKDKAGNIVKEEKIDSYETDKKGKDGKLIRIKNTAWPSYLGWPSCFMRWFRLNWGKSFKVLGKDSKGHTIYGSIQDARKHHALNLLTQWFNLLLGYNLLSHLFGSQIAFIAMLLFAVHPCGVQTVGWISGVNYLFSIFWALITFNSVLYITNPYILFPLISFCTLCSCATLLPGAFNFVILLMMGFTTAAIPAGLVGLYMLLSLGKWSMNFRVAAFKEQQMGKSTNVYGRKWIIMVKTFWYYVRLVLWPKRLGLFHTWGYHFEDPIEHIDREFWLGAASIIAYGLAIYFAPFAVKFGLVWAFVYLLIFSNIITAQQFVSERYAFISIFGISLSAAYYLQGFPIVTAFLIGLAVMRVWVHLPTFQNEVRFYESNCINFPESEVAMGNLGVAYLNHGLANKSLDTWLEASRQNSLYDVPWYNLYSLCKQNGDLWGAKKFLTMCLNAKTIHFPDQWKKEMSELDGVLSKSISVQDVTLKVNKALKEANYGFAGVI
jgi:hypothetical protein